MSRVIFRVLEDSKCPCCGSGLYERAACKSLEAEGFRTMLRCVKSGCGYMEGLERESEPHDQP